MLRDFQFHVIFNLAAKRMCITIVVAETGTETILLCRSAMSTERNMGDVVNSDIICDFSTICVRGTTKEYALVNLLCTIFLVSLHSPEILNCHESLNLL